MPIYEYTCEKCNCDFEMLVTSTDDRHVTCPKCKKIAEPGMHRRIEFWQLRTRWRWWIFMSHLTCVAVAILN